MIVSVLRPDSAGLSVYDGVTLYVYIVCILPHVLEGQILVALAVEYKLQGIKDV